MANQEDLYAYYDTEDVEETSEDSNYVGNEDKEQYEDEEDIYSDSEYEEYEEEYDEDEYYDEEEYRKEKIKNIIFGILFGITILFAIVGVITLVHPQIRGMFFSTLF